MTQGKSIEHTYWNVFNTSYKSLCWWQLQDASCMEKLVVCIAQVWFWPILPHKQSSNLEGSMGLFYELWSLVLSINCLLDSSQVIGWAILAALFSFSETSQEFHWLCLGSLSLWNVHPHFIFIILVDGSRFFIKNVSVHFSSFLQLYELCQCYTMMFWGWCAVPFDLQTWCVLWHPKTNFFVSSVQTIFCQYFTGLSKCCAANFKPASTCFFFSNRALRGERTYRPRRLSALLIVFFETIIHANSRSFWSSPQVILGSWTTLLKIIFTPLSEILRGAPGLWPVYGELMLFLLPDYGPNSAHWNIQKYRNPSVTNAISMLCNNNVVKVLRKLFAFTHHEMFLVWHVGNETPFYRPSVGTEPTNINFHWQDCFLITDRFQQMSWLSMPFCTSLSSCVQYFFLVSFHFITTYLFCFLHMYGLFGLLPTSCENFISTAPLEIYLLWKMVMCSILILPAVFIQLGLIKLIKCDSKL